MVDESTQLPQQRRIANYRLGRVIGQGGWGVVYEAVNTRNDERVALKLLHAHLAGDEAYRERFQREAQVATLLRSPYTVHLLDFGVDAGQHFLVMNLIEGEVLSEIVKQGPLPPARAFKIASQVALALEEAEARGVVHRDIKPDNVMVTPDEGVKVLDFGIARQTGRATLTHTGAFIGTLTYAAPEAAEGRVDHRSDLYSLGVTLFHMLTGQPPFAGEMIQLLRQHREEPVPRHLLEGLPDDATEAVLRLLEKLPDDRYQTASETAGVLEHLSIAAAAREDSPLELEATEPLTRTADTSLITMALEPSGISRRFVPRASMTTYELTFQNDGSQAMTLQLNATDPSDSCEIIVPKAVAVPPRSAVTVSVSVAPQRRRWRGRAEQRPFRITASGKDGGPPIVAIGEFEDRPQGVRPVGGAVFGIALLAALAVFMIRGGDATSSAPPAEAPEFAAVAGSSLDDQGTLKADTPSAGAIAEPGEVDSWSFTVAAGQIMTLGVSAIEADDFHPYIELVAPDGSLLAFVPGSDGEAWLDYLRFSATGEYRLRVRSFDAFDRGGYAIELIDEDADSVFTFTDAMPGEEEIPVGGGVFASLDAAQSADWKFTAAAGVVISLGAESYIFAPFDLFIDLIGPDGESLGRDGSVGSGGGWLDDVRLRESGVYTIRISTLGDTGGIYGIFVELSEAADAAASSTPQPDGQPGVTTSGTQGTAINQALLSALSSIGGSQPRAVVGSEGAIFFIPFDTARTFAWNLDATKANTVEFLWKVEFELSETTFTLAMTRAKQVDELAQSGTFAQLVDASAVALRRKATSGNSTVLRDAGPLIAIAVDDGIVLAVADAQYVSALRQQRPDQVRLAVSGTLQTPAQTVVDVIYVDSLAALPAFGGAATATPTAQTTATPVAQTPPSPVLAAAPPALTSGAVVVRDNEVTFLFRLDTSQEFGWNAESTPNNTMELKWAAGLPLGDKTYELRLTHIKRGGAVPGSGAMAAFLDVGEIDLWELKVGRSTTVRAVGLRASVTSAGLELVLGDPDSVTQMRKERPATLTLIAGGYAELPREIIVTVQYLDSGRPTPPPEASATPEDTGLIAPLVLGGGASVVLQNRVLFLFQLDTSQRFRWNEESTRENVIDVMWRIELPLGDELYELQLMHVKQAGSTPTVGNLATFLADAQLAIWLREGNRTSLFRRSGVSLSIVAAGLELVIDDAVFVNLIREERPVTLTLVASGASQARQTVVTTVQYQDSGPP